MLNMLDTQDKLKNFSEQQLIQEMQMPSGSAPQFMVLGEIERRKRMRQDAMRQEGLMQPTVAQEAVSAAGVPQQGIAQVAQSLAPKTDMTQNTGVPSAQAAGLPAQPNQPVKMAGGGRSYLNPALTGLEQFEQESIRANPRSDAALRAQVAELAQAGQRIGEIADRLGAPLVDIVDVGAGIILDGTIGLGAFATDVMSAYQSGIMNNPDAGETYAKLASKMRDYTDSYYGEGNIFPRASSAAAEADPGFVVPEAGRRASQAATVARKLDARPTLSSEGMPATPLNYIPESIIQARQTPAPSVFSRFPASMDVVSAKSTELGDMAPYPAASKDMGVRTVSGYGGTSPTAPYMDSAPDVSALTDEQARRLYLSGRDFPESGVPSVVDMLNREREFQESDTYTPPEMIYDLGPRGRLKYEMDGASPLEVGREFGAVSNRLADEAAADEAAKEERSFTAQDALVDAQRRADDAIDRRMYGDQPEGPLPLIDRLASGAGEFVRGLGTDVTTGTPLEVPAEGIGALMPPQRDGTPFVAKPAITPTAPAMTGGAGGSGGAAPTEKSGIEAAKSKMDQDKWLALAQAGLTLMSTGDFGRAGLAGLESLSQAKAADREERKLEAELLLREAQMAAANRKGTSGGSGLTANQLLSRGNDLIKSGQSMLEAAGDNADAAEEARALIDAGRNLIRQVTGGTSTSATGAIKLPSAG